MLDLERDRLRPIVDLAVLCRRLYAGSERAETACGAERKECGAAILPCGAFELGLVSVDIRLLRATFVLFDTVLSSMKPHQVLCLVLHACCLSLSARF